VSQVSIYLRFKISALYFFELNTKWIIFVHFLFL
jgi:hypothetical protein